MRKKHKEQTVTLIAEHTDVVGDVHFKNELYINGHIEGNIVGSDDSARVVVTEQGTVRGEIRVANVLINGRVDGDIFGRTKVELAEKAEIHGSVYYRLIEMQLGARVEGQLVHTDELPSSDGNVHTLSERRNQDDNKG